MKLVEANGFGGKLSWNLSLTAASLGEGRNQARTVRKKECKWAAISVNRLELNGRISDRGS